MKLERKSKKKGSKEAKPILDDKNDEHDGTSNIPLSKTAKRKEIAKKLLARRRAGG